MSMGFWDAKVRLPDQPPIVSFSQLGALSMRAVSIDHGWHADVLALLNCASDDRSARVNFLTRGYVSRVKAVPLHVSP